MEPSEYLALSSWLQRSDALYIDARVLWLQVSGIESSFLLMWLSLEQMMKMIVMQERIKGKAHKSKTVKGLEDEMNLWGHRGFGHNLNKLLKKIDSYYANLFTAEEIRVLHSLNRLFEGKYSLTPANIRINDLKVCDCIFFKLRDLTSEDLPMGEIEMIDVDRTARAKRLSQYKHIAYLNNPCFHRRAKYRE